MINQYLLKSDEYNLDNTLYWGLCSAHYQQAEKGSLGHRTVHYLVALVELPPIIGQIISLFEWALFELFGDKGDKVENKETSPPVEVQEKAATLDPLDFDAELNKELTSVFEEDKGRQIPSAAKLKRDLFDAVISLKEKFPRESESEIVLKATPIITGLAKNYKVRASLDETELYQYWAKKVKDEVQEKCDTFFLKHHAIFGEESKATSEDFTVSIINQIGRLESELIIIVENAPAECGVEDILPLPMQVLFACPHFFDFVNQPNPNLEGLMGTFNAVFERLQSFQSQLKDQREKDPKLDSFMELGNQFVTRSYDKIQKKLNQQMRQINLNNPGDQNLRDRLQICLQETPGLFGDPIELVVEMDTGDDDLIAQLTARFPGDDVRSWVASHRNDPQLLNFIQWAGFQIGGTLEGRYQEYQRLLRNGF